MSRSLGMIVAFSCGAIFALGLAIAGMTDASKVSGFLSFLRGFDHWDPTLAFVMGGAIAVFAPIAWTVRARNRTWLGGSLHQPKATKIDPPLLLGAVLFGVGWGLSGFCPGPVLASIATGTTTVLVFVAAMVGAMAATTVLQRKHSDD